MIGFRKPEATVTIADPGVLTREITLVAQEAIKDTQAIKRSLPEVAAEVMALCQQASADALRVEKVVSKDPFISAQIVQVANSPMFAPRMPIVSVRDAIVRIGLSNVNDIVMMVVTSSTMFRVRGFEAYVQSVTSRFPATALAARLIAGTLKLPMEAAFTAGLLHDIGILILLDRCAKAGKVTPEMAKDAITLNIIQDALHTLHSTVGAAVCTIWKLPSSTIDAAQHHHQYKVGGHHFSANLVSAADFFADVAGVGIKEKRHMDPATEVLRDLGLKGEQVLSTYSQFEKLLPSIITKR